MWYSSLTTQLVRGTGLEPGSREAKFSTLAGLVLPISVDCRSTIASGRQVGDAGVTREGRANGSVIPTLNDKLVPRPCPMPGVP